MTNIPKKVIFDASALITLFAKEKGWELIKTHLATGIISSVNLSEVYKYCIEVQKLSIEECQQLIKIADLDIYDFTNEQALIAASIIEKTKQYGLSFADRACVALSMHINMPIITCNRIWSKIDSKLGLNVILAK